MIAPSPSPCSFIYLSKQTINFTFFFPLSAFVDSKYNFHGTCVQIEVTFYNISRKKMVLQRQENGKLFIVRNK